MFQDGTTVRISTESFIASVQFPQPYERKREYRGGNQRQAQPHQGTRMSGWRDISTAPRDGTEILVWSAMNAGKCFLAVWDDNRFARKPRPYWSFCKERLYGTWTVRKNQPTHWMPLPEPPVKP
jgi:hypothetical protein